MQLFGAISTSLFFNQLLYFLLWGWIGYESLPLLTIVYSFLPNVHSSALYDHGSYAAMIECPNQSVNLLPH